MTLSAADVIARLELRPHPEGGHYRETFRDKCVDANGRAHSTAIYFLLARGDRSHWHRVDTVEIWHFYAGSADAVRLLLDRGADVDARDETWDSHPVVWAAIGSSEARDLNPHPDWASTVQALLEAGANAADVTLSPDEDHQPSPEVATLLKRATITGR